MRNAKLEVRDLSVSYFDLQVLWDVSLKVEDQSIVSIIGPNNAGKSTLLKTIAGLLKPSRGKILLDGEEITDKPPHFRVKRGLVLVPEGRQLFPYLTVRENLESGAFLRSKEEIQDALEWVYQLFPVLKERAKQLAMTLSGGEQQMLAIARALMSKPKLMLFDEPSSGLSPIFTRRIYEMIEKLREEGLTILLVEQNVYSSLMLADYAYVIENGKIVMEGKSQELLGNDHVKKVYLGI
jgi:branched-chain amino acid transport system ATP-binding protein